MDFHIKQIHTDPSLTSIISSKPTTSPTICLNMIVKNESNTITRLFDSIHSFIDCYCICDTGSTDDTVNIIEKYFENKNIPGKVVHEPFINFAHNRNIALQSCVQMSDYVLLMDADMVLEINDFDKKTLSSDSYFLLQGSDNFYYNNLRIIKNNGLYKYIGVTHEYVNTPSNSVSRYLAKNQLFIRDIGDGGSKTNKFERDIQLLTKGIEDESENRERYHFYLANSYYDLHKNEEAIETYRKRITFKGYDHEVWYSYYRIGLAYQRMGEIEKAVYAWLEGYNYLPMRVENIYEIVKHYRICGQQKTSLHFYNMAIDLLKKIGNNKDSYLFLSNDIYTHKLEYEYSIIASWVGVKNINPEAVTILNNCNDKGIINNLFTNMKYYKDVLKPIKVIELTNSFTHLINNTYRHLQSSSSCLIPHKDEYNEDTNGYIMNVRYVNYRITENGSYRGCDDHIISLNKYVFLNNDFKIIYEKLMDVEFVNRRYIGIEDIKIYKNKESVIQFIGTGFHENNKIGMVTGVYDRSLDKLHGNEITPSFVETECEKNWVHVFYDNDDYIIYKWYPLLLCKEVSIGTNTKMLNLVKEMNMPLIFDNVRGSSCGFPFEKEIWFIVHLVSYESPRHYYHMFVKFDDSMKLLSYSAPFKFEGDPIEYSLSLVVEEERVIVNYSNWDKTTKIGIYDKKYIDSIILY